MASSPVASSSRTSAPCAQCAVAQAKYTCPGCSARTCSLPCSKAHKAATACSGVRNPTAYVPMNAYSYSALMSDYTFLEDLGRKSDGVRRDRADDGKGHNARERERVLRSELAKAGFGAVRWLPDGMDTKKLNQTRFNPKTRALQLTVSLTTPGPDPSSPPKLLHSLAPTALLYTLPALASLAPTPAAGDATAAATDAAADPPFLLLPHPTSTAAAPTFYPPTPVDPAGTHTLADAMRSRSWVEFPRFQLWPAPAWAAALAAGKVAVVTEDAVQMPEMALGVKQRVWGKRPAEGEAEGAPDEKKVAGGSGSLDLLDVVGAMTADSAEGEQQLDEAKARAIKEVLGLGGMLGDYGSDDEDSGAE